MANPLRKTMVYLGLADEELEYDEQEQRQEQRQQPAPAAQPRNFRRLLGRPQPSRCR